MVSLELFLRVSQPGLKLISLLHKAGLPQLHAAGMRETLDALPVEPGKYGALI